MYYIFFFIFLISCLGNSKISSNLLDEKKIEKTLPSMSYQYEVSSPRDNAVISKKVISLEGLCGQAEKVTVLANSVSAIDSGFNCIQQKFSGTLSISQTDMRQTESFLFLFQDKNSKEIASRRIDLTIDAETPPLNLIEAGILLSTSSLKELPDVFDYQFLEGPEYVLSEDCWTFSDIPSNLFYRVCNLDNDTPAPAVMNTNGGNGQFLHDGVIYSAHGQDKTIKKRSTIEGNLGEVAFNSNNSLETPNDLVVADGFIFATDFTGNKVFRSSLDGNEFDIIIENLDAPNGIALNKDADELYIAEFGTGKIFKYEIIDEDPFVKLISEFGSTGSFVDGIALDQNHNLYATARDGVHIFHRSGRKLGKIDLPNVPTNLAFGGIDRKTLMITASGGGKDQAIYVIKLGIPGL